MRCSSRPSSIDCTALAHAHTQACRTDLSIPGISAALSAFGHGPPPNSSSSPGAKSPKRTSAKRILEKCYKTINLPPSNTATLKYSGGVTLVDNHLVGKKL